MAKREEIWQDMLNHCLMVTSATLFCLGAGQEGAATSYDVECCLSSKKKLAGGLHCSDVMSRLAVPKIQYYAPMIARNQQLLGRRNIVQSKKTCRLLWIQVPTNSTSLKTVSRALSNALDRRQ